MGCNPKIYRLSKYSMDFDSMIAGDDHGEGFHKNETYKTGGVEKVQVCSTIMSNDETKIIKEESSPVRRIDVSGFTNDKDDIEYREKPLNKDPSINFEGDFVGTGSNTNTHHSSNSQPGNPQPPPYRPNEQRCGGIQAPPQQGYPAHYSQPQQGGGFEGQRPPQNYAPMYQGSGQGQQYNIGPPPHEMYRGSPEGSGVKRGMTEPPIPFRPGMGESNKLPPQFQGGSQMGCPRPDNPALMQIGDPYGGPPLMRGGYQGSPPLGGGFGGPPQPQMRGYYGTPPLGVGYGAPPQMGGFQGFPTPSPQLHQFLNQRGGNFQAPAISSVNQLNREYMEIFQIWDVNRNGYVHFSAFKDMVSKYCNDHSRQSPPNDRIQQIAYNYDSARDGQMTSYHFCSMMTELFG